MTAAPAIPTTEEIAAFVLDGAGIGTEITLAECDGDTRAAAEFLVDYEMTADAVTLHGITPDEWTATVRAAVITTVAGML